MTGWKGEQEGGEGDWVEKGAGRRGGGRVTGWKKEWQGGEGDWVEKGAGRRGG